MQDAAGRARKPIDPALIPMKITGQAPLPREPERVKVSVLGIRVDTWTVDVVRVQYTVTTYVVDTLWLTRFGGVRDLVNGGLRGLTGLRSRKGWFRCWSR